MWNTCRNRLIPALIASQFVLVSAAPPSAHEPYTISDNVDLVLLDVSVKDPQGGFVVGLEESNFQVFEDGHPRTITHFASVDTPVTVGLVVDNSGSMRGKRPEVVTAGLGFAKSSNPQDEFFVVNFNDSVVRGLPPLLPFTDDLQVLRAGLYYGKPVGQTALYDAVAYALRHLDLGHRDKRTLIVVSDGGDNVSRLSFSELTRLVVASRATIYTVGLFDQENRELNPGVLRKLANVSGGEYFQPASIDQVIPVFEKISRDIRNRYTVGYIPDETKDRRAVRSVKVRAQDHGRKLSVRTRTSYSIPTLSSNLSQQAEQRPQ
jgi:Ca-activated chloride channel homolog